MTTLTSDDLISEITAELSKLPYAQRVAAVHAYQKLLEEPEAMELKYAWSLHARDSQLPPEGNWDTWLILAGRGFGKTRTGAEWVRAQSLPRTPIRGPRPPRTPNSPRRPNPPRSTVHHDRGRVRTSSTSARPRTCPPTSRPSESSPGPAGHSRSPSPATNPTSSEAHSSTPLGATSSHHGNTQTRPGTTSTSPSALGRHVHAPSSPQRPSPVDLVRSLPNNPGVHVTRGSTFDNKDNLAAIAFFNGIIEQYDGTRIGQQEILRRAYGRGRRRSLEARVDRKCTAPDTTSVVPNRRRRRPRNVHRSHKLRDRHSRRRSRHATPARIRPRRRVGSAKP